MYGTLVTFKSNSKSDKVDLANRGFSPARLIVRENATCINYKQGAFKNNIRPSKIQDTLMGVPQGEGAHTTYTIFYTNRNFYSIFD